jgi:6-phosphogluconolactonase (cycloisomerase 2 family)
MKCLPRIALSLVFFAMLLLSFTGCSGMRITLTSIAVTPASPSIKVGATQQFMAMGTYSNNSSKDITSQVTWNSGATTVATISAAGLATGVAAGTSSITASLSGITSPPATLTVVALTKIDVTPVNPSVAAGLTQQFTATGTFSDNSTQDLTTQVTWDSSNKAVATISAAGLATTLTPGSSLITAALSGITSPPDTLTVTAALPVSIQISPLNPTVAVGQTVDFTAVVKYTDGSTQPPAGPVTWTSGTTATASILSPAGIASALAVGTSQITVTDAATTLSSDTLLTVSAAVSRFAYAPNLGGGSVSIYALNSSAGVFTPVSVLHDASSPSQILPDPSGRFAYALETNETISVFTVDPVTGALTPSGLAPVSSGGSAPPDILQGVIDPTGRFLYVVNPNSGNVAAFSINTSTGAVTSLGAALPVGSGPVAAILDRTAKFLYVVNGSNFTGAAGVNGFSVNPDGSLSPLTTPTFVTGAYPQLPTIDPSNQFLYVPNFGDNTVSVYSIGANGLLTPITGSPFSIASFSGPVAVVTDPAGKFLFVLNNGTTTGSVSVANIVAGGGLGTEVTGSPFAAGAVPFSMVMDPAGKFVAVANNFDNSLSLYTLNSSTGFLTPAPVPALETQVSPYFINVSIGIAAPSVSPADVFASNSGSNDISAFTVTPSTGALTATASSPVASGITGNSFAASDMAGSSFYTASPSNSKLAGFSITQSSAALTQLAASPATLAAAPGNIFAEPSSRFVYLADPSANGIFAENADLTGPVTGSPFTHAAVTSLNAMVGDPQGTLLYALGTNSISAFDIRLNDGTVTYSTTQPASGTWTSGAIDPSGHYLVALDSAGKALSVFQISPILGFGTDGALTPVGTPVPVGGTAPSSVTFDPLGRFVFVSDSTAGTVTSFAFDESTGQLTVTGKITNVSSTGAPQTAADATGTYLYVSIAGNPPATPAGVAAYKINSDGSLTAVAGSPFAAGTGTFGVAVVNKVQ